MTPRLRHAGRAPDLPGHAHLLPHDVLRAECDASTLGFSTTDEVEAVDAVVGQDRAMAAIAFGLKARGEGYNVFVTGPVGTGARPALESRLEAAARERPAPPDWVYLFNFDDPRRPRCAELPNGEGRRLARAMERFIADARREITRAFERAAYQERRRAIEVEIGQGREADLAALRTFATQHGFAVDVTPTGLTSTPLIGGRPATPELYAGLSEEERATRELERVKLEHQMSEFVAATRAAEREARDRIRSLDREVALFAVGHLVDEIAADHGTVPVVADWLENVREDVIEHLDELRLARAVEEGQVPVPIAAALRASQEFDDRYRVNVFVEGGDRAPVVVEADPTYQALFGRLEYESLLGATTTDHMHLRAGAIHRANGGYLLLNALELVTRPFLWGKLKEILRTGRAPVENLGEQLMLIPTTTLTAEPVAVQVKVVLIGRPEAYRVLYALDEDVRELFRVKAEFDTSMPWGPEQERDYARFVSSRVADHGLRRFDAGAVARVIEQGARMANHQRKLSTRFTELSGLVAEASHWAGEAGVEVVRAQDVQRAIDERSGRSSLVEHKLDELLEEGVLDIAVQGTRVGEVNGLAVADLADYRFARPVRVTATCTPGKGELVSIDRESKLSGPLHDKGFMIMSGFLSERYGAERPLSVHAELTFEQSYDEVEGDSAAAAELYALLSSLAQVAIHEGIAVTGSVDQHGDIQAIGAINEKIEGFFAVCKRKGLTGRQGVLIPKANRVNLMLADEVVAAVRDGRFHVWAIERVDEGIELLMGLPPGERGADGRYPAGTLHRKVEERLAVMAEKARLVAPRDNGRPEHRE